MSAIIDIGSIIGGPISTLIDRLVPDRNEASRMKAELERSLAEAGNQIALAQIELNKAEAQHSSVFVAGWRPAIGWACALGFAWTFVGRDFAAWVVTLGQFGAEYLPPPISGDYLFEMTLAMLGLSANRSFDKLKGIATTNIGSPPKAKPR